MAKTKEELNTLKQEYESLNNRLKELDDDELKQVTGGTNIEDSFVPGEKKESEHNYKPKCFLEEKCEPVVVSAMIQHEGRNLQGQKAVCSDLAFKGTKPECQNCNANK